MDIEEIRKMLADANLPTHGQDHELVKRAIDSGLLADTFIFHPQPQTK